jgi:hypothetical protein
VQSQYIRLLQENRKKYTESNPIQNVAEKNQVIKTEEELERALKFSKLNKSQGSGVVTINY